MSEKLLTPGVEAFIRKEICLPCVHWAKEGCDEESKYCKLNRKAYVAIARKLEAQLRRWRMSTYVVGIHCENCGLDKIMDIPVGQQVSNTKCPNCGCKRLRRR